VPHNATCRESEASSRGDDAGWSDLAGLNKCTYERLGSALRSWVDKSVRGGHPTDCPN